MKILIATLTAGAVFLLARQVFAQVTFPTGAADRAASCSALKHFVSAQPSDSLVITEAILRPAGEAPAFGRGGPPPQGQTPANAGGRGGAQLIPENCEVLGKIAERDGANGQTYAIRFRLRLPTQWNGRFYFGGGGGLNGNIGPATGPLPGMRGQTAIELGYAVVGQDSGHDGATNVDAARGGQATFGFDAEARRNYGFASIGPVTTASKALINAYYGRPPQYSYFVGGSKGGQEAFMAVQRFSKDFDGVLAGYPGFRLANAAIGAVWDSQAFAAIARKTGAIDADGLPLINKAFTDADLALASDAILSACDALDGLKDGMVLHFAKCTTALVAPAFDKIRCRAAKADTCLSADQIAALRRVYGGARDVRGRPIYAGWAWDAGIGGRTPSGYFTGWRGWKLGSYESAANNAANIVLGGASSSAIMTSPPTAVANNSAAQTKYTMGVNVTRQAAASLVKWGSFRESAVDFMNADATNLSSFHAHGGKLLIYHGVSDPIFSITDTIAWLEAVNKVEKGNAGRFVRLFPVPGMNHGGGGPATDQIDLFTALVAWTENGRAPDTLVGTAGAGTNWPGRTRLLCPWPGMPHYAGGDAEKAESFRCVQ